MNHFFLRRFAFILALLLLPSVAVAATFRIDFTGTVQTIPDSGVTGIAIGDAFRVSVMVDPSLAPPPPAGETDWLYTDATTMISGAVGTAGLPDPSGPGVLRIRDQFGAGFTDALRLDIGFGFAITQLFGVPVTSSGMTILMGNLNTTSSGQLWNDVALTPAKFTQAILEASTSRTFQITGNPTIFSSNILATGRLDSVSVSPAVVPLPGALVLLLCGLSALGAVRCTSARSPSAPLP